MFKLETVPVPEKLQSRTRSSIVREAFSFLHQNATDGQSIHLPGRNGNTVRADWKRLADEFPGTYVLVQNMPKMENGLQQCRIFKVSREKYEQHVAA